MEIVSLEPYIAVMHNFITNSETEELITKAGPKLKRSFVDSSKFSNSTMGDDNRVSEQTFSLSFRADLGALRHDHATFLFGSDTTKVFPT